MKDKLNKWKAKYIKMWKQELPDYNSAYIEKSGITLDKAWCILKETAPGEWKVIYENPPEDVWNSSPFPLDIQDGNIPDLYNYDWTEISEKEANKVLFIEKL